MNEKDCSLRLLLCSQAGLFSSAFWGVARHFCLFHVWFSGKQNRLLPLFESRNKKLNFCLIWAKKKKKTLINPNFQMISQRDRSLMVDSILVLLHADDVVGAGPLPLSPVVRSETDNWKQIT